MEERAEVFYQEGDSSLRPVYRANMDRLRDFRNESENLIEWAHCLVFRLHSDRIFDTTCLRADFVLDGMTKPGRNSLP